MAAWYYVFFFYAIFVEGVWVELNLVRDSALVMRE